jgi:hypothetical protein
VRAVNLVLVLLVLGGGLWWVFASKSPRPPAVEEEGIPAPSPASPLPATPVTGSLVIRVRTADGSPLPAGTEAGYFRFGDLRSRVAAQDGTFPFSDAPVGRLDVTAKAPGWSGDTVPVSLVPGVPAEAIVTLTPKR